MNENICQECTKSYSNISNLRKHVRKFHNLQTTKEYKYNCDKCGKNFNSEKNFKFHVKKVHGIPNQQPHESKTENGRKCSLCDFISNSTAKLIEHFQETHEIRIEFEEVHFNNLQDFNQWKSIVEKSTNSFYARKQNYPAKSHKTMKYNCHRSGYYISESKGKRRLKTQGSNKINGYCPASLTVVVDINEKVQVKFCKTHVGHANDIERLTLTSEERQSIAAKIDAGIPFSVILDDMRDSVENSNLQRKHLLTKKDLHNIKSGINLNSTSVRHKEDTVSVEARTKEMEDSFMKKKLEIKNQFLDLLNSTSTVAQLEVFERNIAPIGSTLAAFAEAAPQQFVNQADPNVHKIRIERQRRPFSTNKSKLKRQNLAKPTSEEIEVLESISIIYEN